MKILRNAQRPLVNALRRRYAIFDGLWQRFPDNIFLIRCGDAGRFYVEAINPPLEAMFGMTSEEACGKPIEEVVPADYLPAVLARYQECVASRAPLSYEEIGAADQANPQYWLTIMVPAVDGQGRVEYILGISRDITLIRQAEETLRQANEVLEKRVAERTAALEAANQRLRELAIHDGLTGLYNRRHFFELAEHAFRQTLRSGFDLSVVMVDLDSFKRINDSLGHAAGDLVLREIAGVFRLVMRESDIVGRYGGEEFAVLMSSAGAQEACRLAERLQNAVADSRIQWRDTAIQCTLSAGVAQYSPQCDASLDALIERADVALFEAKSRGRNCIVVSRPDTSLCSSRELFS
ncbi:sensor domain-containing diguanylate cyclase [Paludibacterium paludis]|uniref:diguanylate cyclase n=1 Tax=Paludibacterium paludis TaxID=1225769 RepID=A0A918NXH8_9NEIS|nr:sensor domain-containing diguanylate cyclase [Paludibacterium paludis]GGY04933.1 hypothetical protein GCM10011289_04350 [Paludibacterium paludis]